MSTREALANRILQGHKNENFTLIIIHSPPGLLGTGPIAVDSTQDREFMKESIKYAHFAICEEPTKGTD